MAEYIENYLPPLQTNYAVTGTAFNTNKPALFGSTVGVTGAATFASTVAITGNTTITGSLAVTGTITGPRTANLSVSAAVGATIVLTAAQSGSTCINASTSGSPSWTLPAVASGLEFTFICANATAGFTITGNGASVIHAKTSATGTAITSTATSGAITNTQATAVVGDALQLICDGTTWWPKAQTGIFAAS